MFIPSPSPSFNNLSQATLFKLHSPKCTGMTSVKFSKNLQIAQLQFLNLCLVLLPGQSQSLFPLDIFSHFGFWSTDFSWFPTYLTGHFFFSFLFVLIKKYWSSPGLSPYAFSLHYLPNSVSMSIFLASGNFKC